MQFRAVGRGLGRWLFGAMDSLLKPGGHMLAKTLHLRMARGHAPYKEGSREDSWAVFSEQFRHPATQYFRTIESWQPLFEQYALRLIDQREPLNPQTHLPASISFIAQQSE